MCVMGMFKNHEIYSLCLDSFSMFLHLISLCLQNTLDLSPVIILVMQEYMKNEICRIPYPDILRSIQYESVLPAYYVDLWPQLVAVTKADKYRSYYIQQRENQVLCTHNV